MKSLVNLLEKRHVIINGYYFSEGDRYILGSGYQGTIVRIYNDGSVTWQVDGCESHTTGTNPNWAESLRPFMI